MLSMGSSLRVTPAADLPLDCGKNPFQKHVIINLQKTPGYEKADLVIHALIDDVIEKLMAQLSIPIPEFRLDRWVKVQLEESKTGKETVVVNGIDKLGGTFDLFKSVKINGSIGYNK